KKTHTSSAPIVRRTIASPFAAGSRLTTFSVVPAFVIIVSSPANTQLDLRNEIRHLKPFFRDLPVDAQEAVVQSNCTATRKCLSASTQSSGSGGNCRRDKHMKVTPSQLRHASPKIVRDSTRKRLRTTSRRPTNKVVKRMLPTKFSEQFKERNAATTA